MLGKGYMKEPEIGDLGREVELARLARKKVTRKTRTDRIKADPQLQAQEQAKRRARARARYAKIKADPAAHQRHREQVRLSKKRRLDADPEFRKMQQKKKSERLARRASPDGGDPAFRAKRLAYMVRYNAMQAERRKARPEGG